MTFLSVSNTFPILHRSQRQPVQSSLSCMLCEHSKVGQQGFNSTWSSSQKEKLEEFFFFVKTKGEKKVEGRTKVGRGQTQWIWSECIFVLQPIQPASERDQDQINGGTWQREEWMVLEPSALEDTQICLNPRGQTTSYSKTPHSKSARRGAAQSVSLTITLAASFLCN